MVCLVLTRHQSSLKTNQISIGHILSKLGKERVVADARQKAQIFTEYPL